MMPYSHGLVTRLRAARPGYPPGELCVKTADVIEHATRYAEMLAVSFAARWHPEDTQWKPASDLIGLLEQIDYLTRGLVRIRAGEEGYQNER
jgi:hypothetical protein